MTHDNRHLTTEQLSAFIDGALSSEESSWVNAHMQTCEQCQQKLAELRFTVSLLRSMPQPRLPRSFALPVESESHSTGKFDSRVRIDPLPLAAYRAMAIEPLELEPVGDRSTPRHMDPPTTMRPRRRAWPTAVRRTIGALSTLAAVIGLFFLFSGLFVSLQPMATSTGAAPTALEGQGQTGNSASPCQDQIPCGTAISLPQESPTPEGGSVASGGANPDVTATPSSKGAPTPVPTEVGDSNVFSLPEDPEGLSGSENSQTARQDYAPTSPLLDLIDLNSTLGRVTLGLLLVLLSTVGFLLVRIQQKRSASS